MAISLLQTDQKIVIGMVFLFFGSLLFPRLTAAQTDKAPKLTVQKIWNQGLHNAFTDLALWQGSYYCTFREGSGHVPGENGTNGVIRIIKSTDGQSWETAGLLADQGVDLRDPKLSVTPDNRLMVLMGGSHYDGRKLMKRYTRVAFLKPDETEFSKILPVTIDRKIASENDWLWRVTWIDGRGYGVIYQANDPKWGLHLVTTHNGIDYAHAESFDVNGKPNESTIRQGADGKLVMLVRNEAGGIGHIAHRTDSRSDWIWNEIQQRLGGPNLIQLPDGRWMMGTRQYGRSQTTVLGELALDGTFNKLVDLPSGGDTSYPGMLLHDNQLWVSYYSGHEGKTSIYLARIPLDQLQARNQGDVNNK